MGGSRNIVSWKVACLIPALFFLSSCSFTGNVVKESIPQDEGSISAYFCPASNCSGILVSLIDSHAEAVCAFYDLSDKGVMAALQEKDAKVEIDDEQFFGYGTKVHAAGLMHDKFCVFDRKVVWVGSYNPTAGGANHQNNVVVIDSPMLAKNYLAEFDDLRREQSKKQPVEHPKVNLSGVLIENYFCPEDHCETKVLAALRDAKVSVHFLTYSFTSDRIGEYLASRKDLDIRGVFEEQQIQQYSEFEKLKVAGFDVRIYELPYLLHDKIFIIDGKTVITGSFNPTANADRNNDENVLIIHDEKLAKEYETEFERLFQLSG
jgi:phosphatidylserine/phosphatidylglycerophosphate/cardiolipin synthase-like enzyme